MRHFQAWRSDEVPRAVAALLASAASVLFPIFFSHSPPAHSPF